ncbi:MAG: hypothetical protein NC390_07265 [Fusobacterium sp.]|nr:hypothetical protein [Fusobacterium sp.]
MKNTLTRCRELLSGKSRLSTLKRELIRKRPKSNILESWKDNSSTASLGCDFDIINN